MRFFRRAPRHRLAAASVACALAVGALAVPVASAEDDLERQKKQVAGQVEEAHDDLEHSSARVRRATAVLETARGELALAQGELDAARSRLTVAQARDQEMQARLTEAEDRLESARADLVTGRGAMDEQQLQVTDTVTSIYQQGDPQLIAFASILNADTPSDLTRRSGAQEVLVGRETQAYDDLHAAEVLLEVREMQVEEATDEVAEQRAAAAAHLDTMRILHEETRVAEAQVRRMVGSSRTAREAATAARRQDQAALQRLERQEEQIRQRILEQVRRAREQAREQARQARQARRAQEQARRVQEQARRAKAIAAARILAARSLGVSRPSAGFLAPPVSAVVTSPFGYRNHPIYKYWGMHDGTDFGAACGQPLYAVADGHVMSAYSSSVFGQRLYLNAGLVNGRNLTVVYNHAASYTVARGAKVQRGQVIGYVGSTGWSTGCHLHFTVLANGSPVDPENWF